MNRVRAALLRLAPPWRRRHPVVLGGGQMSGEVRVWVTPKVTVTYRDTVAYYAAERDPTDEAGA